MTQEEYEREQREIERLINEINRTHQKKGTCIMVYVVANDG
mgnify:FL=1